MPLDQPDDSYDSKEMSFLDHVDELRKHLFRSVVAVLLGTIVAFIQKELLFDTLIFGPKRADFWTYRIFCRLADQLSSPDLCIKDLGFTVKNLSMSGAFTMHIYVAFIAGLILAAPFILWEVWRFIKPALRKSEHKKVTGIVFYCSILFLTGVLFGYFFLTPVSLSFLGPYQVSADVANEVSLESYIDFVATLSFATGAVFELPVLAYFLARLGVIGAAFMKKYRRHAALVILIVSAIVTPPDAISMVMMTIPLYGLYELSIFIAARVDRRRLKKQQA